MIHIFTFATDETRLRWLKLTSALSDSNITYILKSRWNGYVDKILGVKEAIEKLDDNDIVCFIDAYDVLSLSSNNEIEKKFKDYDCDLLISSELNCYPEKYKILYDTSNDKTKFSYVNSGGYIGYVKAIKELMNWKSLNEIIDICNDGGDQSYFTEYYLNNKNVKLDIYQKIFQSMHKVSWKEIEFVNKRIRNTVLNELPCFIHFNGGSFQTIERKDISEIVVERLLKSKNIPLNLDDYNQIITSTCFPESQVA